MTTYDCLKERTRQAMMQRGNKLCEAKPSLVLAMIISVQACTWSEPNCTSRDTLLWSATVAENFCDTQRLIIHSNTFPIFSKVTFDHKRRGLVLGFPAIENHRCELDGIFL